jgi:hypothetical protein
MIKPKYPKQADLSQLARLAVEHAVGRPLTPERPDTETPKSKRKKKRKSR